MAKFADHREQFANRIVPTLEAPDEVWSTLYDTAGGVEYRLRYLKFYREAGARARDTLAIATETADGHLLWNVMTTGRGGGFNAKRVGNLLYRREGD